MKSIVNASEFQCYTRIHHGRLERYNELKINRVWKYSTYIYLNMTFKIKFFPFFFFLSYSTRYKWTVLSNHCFSLITRYFFNCTVIHGLYIWKQSCLIFPFSLDRCISCYRFDFLLWNYFIASLRWLYIVFFIRQRIFDTFLKIFLL